MTTTTESKRCKKCGVELTSPFVRRLQGGLTCRKCGAAASKDWREARARKAQQQQQAKLAQAQPEPQV